MTSVGSRIKYNDGEFMIYLSVSGDLSCSYRLVPSSSYDGRYIGVGYGFKDMKDAKKYLKLAKKYGYKSEKFHRIYDRYVARTHYGYLSFHEAKPYLKDAYGEVAERYRRKLKSG